MPVGRGLALPLAFAERNAMARCNEHPPGSLCYVELASPDPAASRQFYGSLFGWTVRNEDMGEHGIYTQFLKEGDVTGALYELQPQQKEAGMPPSWGLYLSVKDVDTSAAKLAELGGNIVMGPMDVFDHGRMVIAADPMGAVFCLWQARQNIGVERKDEHGALCWGEIMTSDTDRALTFYRGLFGWDLSAMEMGSEAGGTYHMLGNGPEAMTCGMMQITPDMGPVPPSWLAYFMVDDIQATCDRATELDARVLVSPTPIPGGSRFAVIRDPQGAHCGLFQGGSA
jgi:predicted enzyme related to lactoylglutathione lyase